MSLLGAPLEQQRIDEIRGRFPGFERAVPEEARYWSEGDLGAFLGSNGEVRPRSAPRAGGRSCGLLTRARLRLAGAGGSAGPTEEYRSFCRRLAGVREMRRAPGASECENWRLPGVAECVEVPQAKSCLPGPLRSPVRIEKPQDWAARKYNMDFWKRLCGEERWVCRARSPAFEDDAEGADTFALSASVAEYVDYARLVHRTDRTCLEDNALANPRLSLEGWVPAEGPLRAQLAEGWRRLGPEGLQDFTSRWAGLFARTCGADLMDVLPSFYQISLGVTGAITRLHEQAGGAHAWLNQIEGRRLFYLFSPSEARSIYAVKCSSGRGEPGFAPRVGLVDVLSPSARHPSFADARAQVTILYMGQTLLVPAGWSWYSVALEPSVTLYHPFWNLENRASFTDGFRQYVDVSGLPPHLLDRVWPSLDLIKEQVEGDDDSDLDA